MHLDEVPSGGLATARAEELLVQHGPNELPEEPAKPLLESIAEQLQDRLVQVLLASAVVSLVLALLEAEEDAHGRGWTRYIEPLVILAILVLNAVVGIAQEGRAEEAINALRAYAAHEATAIRDGRQTKLSAAHLVPGDLVVVAAGDRVPADGVIVQMLSRAVATDQSLLTGESACVDRSTGEELFMGTAVTRGRVFLRVIATGAATRLGSIHAAVAKSSEKTPLQRQLDAFGQQLAWIIGGICCLVWALGLYQARAKLSLGLALSSLKTAVALAVAAIPEGLSVIITTCLALGSQRMSRKRAIVRRLPSVETLGCCSVVCCDKTGTLTTNRMTVVRAMDRCGRDLGPPFERCDELRMMAVCCALCNDADLPSEAGGKEAPFIGEPTEMALLVFAEAVLGGVDRVRRDNPRLSTWEFDRQRRRMSTLNVERGGSRRVWAKGAPESILPLCRGDAAGHGDWCRDLRVLALAYKDVADDDEGDPESGLTLLGFVAMHDPPRPEARAALAQCRAAGIRVIVVTGDAQGTAEHICVSVGLSVDGGSILGSEFARDPDTHIGHVALISRAEPAHKLLLVSALKPAIVAMTGDGVNDAPALKQAHIGIAMGSGTDVAKLASSLVLADSNFATIVDAIREGRSVYANCRQFIRYLISSNIGEVVAILGGTLLGHGDVLSPVQLLWVNLVTDGLPAMALAFNRGDPGAMQRPPRRPEDPIVDGWALLRYSLIGTYVGLATVYCYTRTVASPAGSPLLGSSMSLTCLVVIEMCNAVNALSEDQSVLSTQTLLSNPRLLLAIATSVLLHVLILNVRPLAAVFGVQPLGVAQWALVIIVSLPVVALDEVMKAVIRRRPRLQ